MMWSNIITKLYLCVVHLNKSIIPCMYIFMPENSSLSITDNNNCIFYIYRTVQNIGVSKIL